MSSPENIHESDLSDEEIFDQYSVQIEAYPIETLQELVKSNNDDNSHFDILIAAAKHRIAKLKLEI
jgi:hypothetical protein